MPNLHFIGDSISKSLFKFKPYFIKEVGIIENTNYLLHDTTFFHFNNLFLDLLLKCKPNKTQVLVFSNSINDMSSDLHSDYFSTLGKTADRLLKSLYSDKKFTDYKMKLLLLDSPYLTFENDLNCGQKIDTAIQTECEKVARAYSREKVTLLNDIYQAIASHHKHVYIIKVSLITNRGSWMDMYGTDLSDLLLDSQILNSIWKSILQLALFI